MRRFLAACAVTVALAGCGSDPEVTAVRIVAQGFPAATYDQLGFVLTVGGAEPDFADAVARPERAAAPLAAPQDLVVYLSDALAGQAIRCGVVGLAGGVPGARAVGQAAEPLRKGRVTACPVRFGDPGTDGGSPALDDGGAPLPDGASPDGAVADSRSADGAPPADGAPSPDAGPTVDAPPVEAPPPGVEAGVPPDAGTPDTETPPPDAGAPPTDAGSPIPDAPLDPDAAPPPDAPVDSPAPPPDTAVPDTAPPSPCVTGGRRGFIDPGTFPTVASCGPASGAVSYEQALAMASTVCAPGWRWCRPDDIRVLGPDDPGQIGAACSWLDSTQFACNDRRARYALPNCSGSASGLPLSAGGPTSGAACLGADLGCGESWKFAVPLDRFNMVSVAGGGGPCLNHVTFQCAANLGTDKCWITCCKQ